MSVDSRLTKLKHEVRGVIMSCPRGLTLNQFLKDYKDSIGRAFPYHELGYDSIPDLLRDMSDVVKLNQGYNGMSSTLIPVTNDKVNHINTMVAKQKLAPNKFSVRNVPRKTVQEEPENKNIRKPVQLPLENKSTNHHEKYTKKETNNNPKESQTYNGYTEKDNNFKYSNSYDDMRSYKYQNSYEEATSSKYSTNEYQNIPHFHEDPGSCPRPIPLMEIEGNDYPEAYYPDSSVLYHDNIVMHDVYYDNEVSDINQLEPDSHHYSDHMETEINGAYDPIHDEDFDRPPTPGEVIITEKMKSNFRDLLSDFHPNGIPSSKFLKQYKDKFGVPLRFIEYGVKSLKEMIANLPDVFMYQKQRNSQDWILYDAKESLPVTESQIWIPSLILENIAKLSLDHPNGFKPSQLTILYREKFYAELNVLQLGFNSTDAFLQSCPTVDYVSINGENLVIPNNTCQSSNLETANSYALPPVSQMNYLWNVNFSENECDPTMSYHPFKLIKKDKLNYAKVYACDVLSPDNIWLQMDDQRLDLDKLMYKLNEYYDKYELDHTLPDSSLPLKNMICTVRFEMDNRWHRAKILSVNEHSDQVSVFYVDYGTENVVNTKLIRKLVKEFYDLPVQAIQASLMGLVPNPKESSKWTPDCIDFFYKLVMEKKFNMDILKIDEDIPKLHIILFSGTINLSVNDQLIAKGYAVPVGHMPIGVENEDRISEYSHEEVTEGINYPTMLQEPVAILDSQDEDKRIRTPPGYSSKAFQSTASPRRTKSVSTCDRVRELQCDAVLLFKEFKQKFIEADVLEHHVCKHPHSGPEGWDQIVNLFKQRDSVVHQPQDSNITFKSSAFCKEDNGTAKGYALPFGPEVNTFTSLPGPSLQGFKPMQNSRIDMTHPQGPDVSYNNMIDRPSPLVHSHQAMHPQQLQQPVPSQPPHHVNIQPPHMNNQLSHVNNQTSHYNVLPTHANHQTSFPHYSQQMSSNLMQNKMVGPSLIMRSQQPYIAGRMAYPPYQPQNIMIPQGQWNNQWGGPPVMPPNMHPPYRQDVYPANPALRPNFKPSESQAHHFEVTQNDNLTSTVQPPSQPTKDSRKNESSFIPSAPPMELISSKPPSPKHEPEQCKEEVSPAASSPPSQSPSPLSTSHLTKKQQMKLDKTEEIVLSAPASNNWSELLPYKSTSSSTPEAITRSSSSTSDAPKETLLAVAKEIKSIDEDKLDEEYRKLDDAITERMIVGKKAINHIMKICVQNIEGLSSNIQLLLVGDSISVLLRQLYSCYWWGENEDEESSYSDFMSKLKDNNIPAYSIFYADHMPIFERLRELDFIAEDDLNVHVVNLSDVPLVLDFICPSEKHDLSHIKKMFNDLSELVLPVDAFWFTKERNGAIITEESTPTDL